MKKDEVAQFLPYLHLSPGFQSLGAIKYRIMNIPITRSVSVCAMSLALIGCSGSSDGTMLTADADHEITLDDPRRPQEPYEIAATSGIQLDIGQVQFTVNGSAVRPDTVYIFDGAQNLYHLAQPINGNVVLLDSSSLSAVTGAPFGGFRPGHHLMLHVGRENPANPGYGHMAADWVALIEVK